MGTLAQKRDRMRRIFRGEEQYGEGTAASQATRYRLAEMYQDVVEAARRNSADVDRPPVDLLVSLSGFSPETTLLSFELVRPTRLLIVSSENARANVDVIWEKLAGRLAFSAIQTEYCEPADPLAIYDIVRRAVVRDGTVLSTIIDITGGKKVMSAGAALAASQLDLPMCYIDSEFDPEMRQAYPGTELLRILPNPTSLFGDREMAAATEMFRSGVYAGAAARFSEISTSMSEPARARFLGDLASLYQAWCDIDTVRMPGLVEQVRGRLVDQRSGVRPETARRLAEQADFVERLVAKDGSALLLSFYLLGEHYFRLDRYDFAALLFYRTIEKSFAERLRRRYGDFAVDRPRYYLLDEDIDGFASRYAAAARKLFGPTASTGLPLKAGLVDALLLLFALDDDLLVQAQITSLGGVSHVRGLADARNESVLAHGEASVTREQCGALRQRALLNLRAFWRLHHAAEDVEERIATLRFVTEA